MNLPDYLRVPLVWGMIIILVSMIGWGLISLIRISEHASHDDGIKHGSVRSPASTVKPGILSWRHAHGASSCFALLYGKNLITNKVTTIFSVTPFKSIFYTLHALPTEDSRLNRLPIARHIALRAVMVAVPAVAYMSSVVARVYYLNLLPLGSF